MTKKDIEFNLGNEERKHKENMNTLVYVKQYERKIPFAYTPLTKFGFFFLVYMAYRIYSSDDASIYNYIVIILGTIFIYRNLVNDKFYEKDSVYVKDKLNKWFNYFREQGKKRYYRYQIEAEKSNKKKMRISKVSITETGKLNRFVKTYGSQNVKNTSENISNDESKKVES